MYSEYDIVRGVVKRAVDDGPSGEPGSGNLVLSGPAFFVVVLTFLAFLPALIYMQYTLKHIYPTLAIIEDENPPAYEPVALDEASINRPSDVNKTTDGQPKAVSSSIKSINRLLRSHGGFLANFRGLKIIIAQYFLTGLLTMLFSASIGSYSTPVATLLASLTLVQFSTAWVHIVVSHPSNEPFWRRLPAFSKTFNATWKPVMLYWAATEFTRWIPFMLAPLLHLRLPEIASDGSLEMRESGGASLWKSIVVMLVTFVGAIYLTIPAHLILVRVQASLMPVDEDAIIPFDRSFQGALVPAVAGGLGYATIGDAWKTFTRAAWKRLVFLYVKVFAISFGVYCVLLALVTAEVVVLQKSQSK